MKTINFDLIKKLSAITTVINLIKPSIISGAIDNMSIQCTLLYSFIFRLIFSIKWQSVFQAKEN